MGEINYLEINGRYWDANSELYYEAHPEHFDEGMHPSWGIWHIPERDLRILIDDLRPGDSIIDLGCGIGHDVVGFAGLGMRAFGSELSAEQFARVLHRENCTYVNAPAERLPFAGGSFDAAFCDHGAFDFSAPGPLLRETRRILRPGGLLAVCTYSPFVQVCFDADSGKVAGTLVNAYGDARARSDGEVVVFHSTYAQWVRLFGEHGFVIERLEELRPAVGCPAYFRDAIDRAWADKWPAEVLWRVRKQA